MPRVSDDDSDNGDSKRGERKASGDKNHRKSESKEPQQERRSHKDDESRRNLRWISFSKPRMVFGFDHLGSSNVPVMSGKTRGISMCFEKISGWHVPPQIYQDLGLGLNNFEFSVQLSLSMFHLTSSSFFGSTWMGRSVPLGNENEDLPDLIDLEYNEIVYLISRLADPSCVGVVEIVVSKISTQKKLVTAQYGCGWTIINLFSSPPPPDLENGHENVPLTSCPFFQGSPRDLALNSNIAILKTRLKEISGCSLQFKLYSQKKLLKAQRLIAENEAIGRFDVVPGVVSKSVTLPGTSVQKSLCCIGDEELIVQGRNGGVFLIPTSPSISIPITLNITDCQVHVPSRAALEGRVKATIAKNLAALMSPDGKDEVQIISRVLKIGLHNGHTVVGGEWRTLPLREDRDDRDVLLTKEQTIIINGYVPHELMALALLLEYEVGVPVPERTQHSAQTLLSSTSDDGKVVTVVTLGVSIYVPFNGEKMILRNGASPAPKGRDDDDDDEELGIELPLRTDDVCTILTPKPLFCTMDSSDASKLKKKLQNASKKADTKGGKNAESDVEVSGDEGDIAGKAVNSIKVAFDLCVVDAVRGGVVKDHEYVPVSPEVEGRDADKRDEDERDDGNDRDNRDRDRDGMGRDSRESRDRDRGHGDTVSSARSDRDVRASARSSKGNRESTASSRKGISISTSQRKRTENADGYESDGAYSITESIVGGDSVSSNLVLDPHLYSQRQSMVPRDVPRRYDDRSVAELSDHQSSQFNVPRDRGSLMAQTMQARLNTHKGGPEKGPSTYETNDVLEDYDGVDRDYHQPPKTRVTSYPSGTRAGSGAGAGVRARSGVTLVSSGGEVNHARELSRGARSRLGRHGFDGTIMDSNTPYDHQKDCHHTQTRLSAHTGVQPVDTALEARDVLAMHDISIQFAGYRVGPATADSDSSASSCPRPRSVYFSYQFYSCEPTRTEVMRLLSSDKGQLCVLCREEAHARDEAPLAHRFLVDCSDASPTEGYDFAEYLARHSLFVDVWDADSLLLLGTCSIPLRRIMRQGQPMAKSAVECDIVDTETAARTVGGVTTLVIQEGCVGVGIVIGAVQVILSNRGDHGKNTGKSPPNNQLALRHPPTQGLNWRAHQEDRTQTLALAPYGLDRGKNRLRPKVSVRARPLSENAPDLSQALLDHRGEEGGRSMRSLTSARGGESERTLTYDDVAILFKRFQGNVKGTVQYTGSLMTLLDVPSWTMALRKLVNVYKLAGGSSGLEKELKRYTDNSDTVSAEDLSDCFRLILERHGIPCKDEEITLLVQHFVKEGSGAGVGVGSGAGSRSGSGGRGIETSEVVEYCRQEVDRQGWMIVSKRVRSAVQKAYVTGTDVEQQLVERDRDGDHFLSPSDFTLFLRDLSGSKKLTSTDIQSTVSHFSRKHPPGSGTKIPTECVSLKEVMGFLGKQYVGNVVARITQCVTTLGADSESGSRSSAEILKVLKSHSSGERKDVMSMEELEGAFRVLGVYEELSHDQVVRTLRTLDREKNGLVKHFNVFQFLGIPPPEGLTATSSRKPTPVATSQNALNAEELLRLLLAQVQKNGLAVDEAFRHFDTDGNGFIGRAELEEGLEQLGIFDNQNIKNWRSQIPDIINKFDKSGDGNVSLKEFFTFLGVESYAPNIVQRMTKIFALATEKGLSFQDIFVELDEDKDGKIHAAELRKGLHKLGTFGEVSAEDSETVVKQFDHNGDKTISLEEFVAFFSSRVKQAATERMAKKQIQLVVKFTEVMLKGEEKGVSVESLFQHFDKDKGGSLSTNELASGLRGLPHFKTLSDGDIQALISAIDGDQSGEVSLKEFKAFLSKHSPPPATDDESVAARLRLVFTKAEDKGLSLESAFEHLDSDGSGQLSCTEMQTALQKMPHFKGASDDDIKRLVVILDTDRSGSISLDEFRAFIRGPSGGSDRDPTSSPRADREDRGNKGERGERGQTPPPRSQKDIFRDQIRRIAKADGGIEGLLAYLDEDEDGIISLSSFMRLLGREQMFQHIPEDDVEDILNPMVRGGGDGRAKGVSVVALLRMLDNKESDKDEVTRPSSEGKEDDGDKDDDDDDKTSTALVVEYDFSPDPETRSLEKKLRALGRALCKKGMDVEDLFRSADVRQTGMVRRTEFVEIMSKIGLSILETGRAMDDAQHQMDGMESGPGSGGLSDSRKQQIMQVKRLKGPEGGYAKNATRAARNLLMNTGTPGYKQKGDFKEHLESMALIDWYRQSQKRVLLQKVLSHSLAASVFLYPRFGKTLFFEQPLTNPFGHEERFLLSLEDSELRLVTAFHEWLHLRQHCRVCVGDLGSEPVEAEMFDKDGYGNIQVALLPHETLFLPFTFMSLKPYVPRGRVTRRGGDLVGVRVGVRDEVGVEEGVGGRLKVRAVRGSSRRIGTGTGTEGTIGDMTGREGGTGMGRKRSHLVWRRCVLYLAHTGT